MQQGTSKRDEPGIISGKEKKPEKKYYGKFLILMVFIIISIEYYSYVFEVMVKYMNQKNFYTILTLLIIFHIILLLLIMAFISTMFTNPGEIPLYWGFYIGDDDYKRKRYCLICNAFKPERSHHCSVCNKCVLNMDHHCPWVDNCIGFYNRKHFMQLLIFVVILTIYIDITEAYFVLDMCFKLFKRYIKYKEIFRLGFVVICYVSVFVFSIIISMFLKFHIRLVLENSTTIESLDQEHKNENAKFNVGKRQNWVQVFGTEPLFWFFPLPTKKGRPDGDGLSWKIKEQIGDNRFKSNESKNFGVNSYNNNINNNDNFSPGTD